MDTPITDPRRLIEGRIATPEEVAWSKAEQREKARQRRTGRPSKIFDRQLVQTLLDGIELGYFYREACQRAGVHYSKFREWIIRGSKMPVGDPYRDFRDAYLRARTKAKDRAMVSWQTAISAGDWKAAAEFMRRRYPKKWGRRLEVTGRNGQPLQGSTVNIGAVNLQVEVKKEEAGREQLRRAIQGMLQEATVEEEAR